MTEHRQITRFLPFLPWLKGYNRTKFRRDFGAGITVAVVLIPQAMAYAMLAGLPPVYGLYAAVVAPLIASMWGSLQQLSTGPIAILSLLVLTTLTPLAEPGTARYIELALLLSFMVGILYLVIGIFRLGAVMSFISHSTVRGFTSAAAVIICATQIPSLLGISVHHHEYLFPMLYDILKGLSATHIPTLTVGLLAFAVIFVGKKYRATFPGGLVALILTTIPLVLFEWHERGIAAIGPTPPGLPRFQLPPLDFNTMGVLLGPAIVDCAGQFCGDLLGGKNHFQRDETESGRQPGVHRPGSGQSGGILFPELPGERLVFEDGDQFHFRSQDLDLQRGRHARRHHRASLPDALHRLHSQGSAFRPGHQRGDASVQPGAGLFSLEKEPPRRHRGTSPCLPWPF